MFCVSRGPPQQMSQFYLNFWVSLFQFIAGVVVAPLALPMQRIMDAHAWDSTGWRLMAKNWRDGAACLFAGADSTDADFCFVRAPPAAVWGVVVV